MTAFPVEIFERILYFCDGETLKTAKLVNSTWKNVVDFLTRRTQIWKWCCFEDIPRNELINYTEKYDNYYDADKWLNIYNTWYAWKNVKDNIRFDVVLCPMEKTPRITYVAVAGSLIAVGSEDGRIKIFGENWNALHSSRYLAVKVTGITFMSDDDTSSDKTNLLLAYKSGTLIVTNFDGRLNDIILMQDIKLYSVYKKYLCYEKRGGRITIAKLDTDLNGRQTLNDITYLRIYSPNEVSSLHMWNGVATFLINNEVKVLKFDQNTPPVSSVQNKVNIKFCLKNEHNSDLSYHIYRDDIIICASTCEKLGEQYIELFILGENNQCSKKMFNSSEIFESNITCMFLYGNIFIIGVDIGNIYFYYVPSWKKFDLYDYKKKFIIGRHPIISIDVKENKNERRFFVTTSYNIHQVIGFPLEIAKA